MRACVHACMHECVCVCACMHVCVCVMCMCVSVQMSEHDDEAMHENGPVMGYLDSNSNGLLTWEEYSSRLWNHVKQLIE